MEGPLALLRRYGHDADPAVLAILHADLDPERLARSRAREGRA